MPWLWAWSDTLLPFSDEEVQAILRHGPWPVPWSADPGNRVSGQADAIRLGERLFFDQRLSGSGTLACASCHIPERNWTDGRKQAVGVAPLPRNTPQILNVRLHRWFGWDGAADSLWSQSLRPILDARELNSSPAQVARLLRSDADLTCRYRKAFGAPPPPEDEALLVDVAKALAAFQETLDSTRTAFDDFRDALAAGDRAAAGRYPAPAQRGLRIFIGKGACRTCHTGPHFTNGEFHDIGVPYFIAPGKVDAGRQEGLRALLASPYNLLGRHNDDKARSTATGTLHVSPQHRNFGEFKVPSLRDVALTAPYMHDGSLAGLRDVVRHYSELNEERLHADGERILKPLQLSLGETDDLVAFLESLTSYTVQRRPEARGACR